MIPIKTAIAASLLAAVAAPALAAGGQPAFDAFDTVCGATHADYPAVVAAADAHGWKATQVKADTLPGVSVTDSVSRDNSAGGAALTLFAWQGVKGKIHVSECKVRVGKGKFAEVQAMAQTWLGFAPQEATPKKATFMFTDDAGGHKALAAADRDAAAAAAGLQILTVSAGQDGAVLGILKIKN